MEIDKDIIYRAFLALAVVIGLYKFIPFFFQSIKEKLPGHANSDEEFEQLIKKQTSRLKNQYNLTGNPEAPLEKNIHRDIAIQKGGENFAESESIEKILKDANWGTGEAVVKIKQFISKKFSYTLNDAKINAFIVLANKRGYFKLISKENLNDSEKICIYLSYALIFHLIVDEIKNNDFAILEMISKKIDLSSFNLALSIQIIFLESLQTSTPLKDDKKYSHQLILAKISDETIEKTIDSILKKQLNLWIASNDEFIIYLTKHVPLAEIISPLPALVGKMSKEYALIALNIDKNSTEAEIKKAYKKLALIYHPDKIGQLTQSKHIQLIAQKKFNIITDAYDKLIDK